MLLSLSTRTHTHRDIGRHTQTVHCTVAALLSPSVEPRPPSFLLFRVRGHKTERKEEQEEEEEEEKDVKEEKEGRQ